MSSASAHHLIAGRYQLEHRIASGGFGEVWRGTDIALGRPVAVKQMRPEAASDAAARARFRSEAQHAGALNHAGIARIYDYDEPDAGPPFLVMEFVDGPSLAEVLAGGPLEPARVMDIMAQVAAGLEAAHQAGLVHPDIKPGNIMLGRDGLVKLTDFGISAAARSAPLTAAGTLLGTPEYLAPERASEGQASEGQASDGRATAASDLYALGVVAYQCLTGKLPFDGTPEELAQAHRRRTMPPLPASVPAEVIALVSELMAKDPAGRPGSAGEVARRAAALHDRLTADADSAASAEAADSAGPRPLSSPDLLPAAGYQAAGEITRPLRWNRPRRQPHYAPLTLAAAGVALIALVVADILVPARAHPVAAPPPRPTVVMVHLDAAELRGRPVDAVRSQLRHLGLKVLVEWRASSQVQPGRVLSVQPSGAVVLGTLVVVTAALQPPATGFWAGPSASTPAPRHPKPRHHGRPRPPARPRPTTSPTPTRSTSPVPTGTPTSTGTPRPTGTPTPTGSRTRKPDRSGHKDGA